MNAEDKSVLDRYARRIALADALVHAKDLDEAALAAIERDLMALSSDARERLDAKASSRGPAAPRLSYGLFKDELHVPDSFFDPLPEEELKAWEGE